MRLSIIIPAYNVEQYLERCIDSCEKQDIPHEDYEVIIVNDGSSDNTLQVANNLAEKYSNIIVLSQDNQGQSVARNLGIEHAKGDYIWFVDSDDYIDENCIGQLIDKAESNSLDILLFHMKITYDGKIMMDLKKQPGPSENIVYGQGEPYFHGYIPGTICSRIFFRSFIVDNDLRFIPNLIHQDAEFSTRAMALARRTMFVDVFAYIYHRHPNTTTTSVNKNKVVKREVDNVRIAKMLHDFATEQKSQGMDSKLIDFLEKRAASLYFGGIMTLWKNRKQWKQNGINTMIIDQLRKLNLYPLQGPYNSIIQRIIVTCILNHPSLFC